MGDINGDGLNDVGFGVKYSLIALLGRDAKLSGTYCYDGGTGCGDSASAATGLIEFATNSGQSSLSLIHI